METGVGYSNDTLKFRCHVPIPYGNLVTIIQETTRQNGNRKVLALTSEDNWVELLIDSGELSESNYIVTRCTRQSSTIYAHNAITTTSLDQSVEKTEVDVAKILGIVF